MYCLGQNKYGELGVNSKTEQFQDPQAVKYCEIISVASGTEHSMAITSKGSLVVSGSNSGNRFCEENAVDQ